MRRGKWFLPALAFCLLVTAAGADDSLLGPAEWLSRGRFMAEIGNFRQAVTAFSRAIALEPTPAAYNNRGVAYSELGNQPAAVRDFTRAIALSPEEPVFWFNRGVAFARQEEYALAIQDFARVLDLEPRHDEALFYLGLLQKGIPGEVHKGADNIKIAARMGNRTAQDYLRSRMMGWY